MIDAAEMLIYQQIGQMIRQRRKARGMTQTQLAKIVKRSHPTIARMELGELRICVHMIYDLAAALDCLPGELVPKPRRRCRTEQAAA